MKRLITSAFVSAALFAAATAMQRSPPTELSAATADRSSLQIRLMTFVLLRRFNSKANIEKLGRPVEPISEVPPERFAHN